MTEWPAHSRPKNQSDYQCHLQLFLSQNSETICAKLSKVSPDNNPPGSPFTANILFAPLTLPVSLLVFCSCLEKDNFLKQGSWPCFRDLTRDFGHSQDFSSFILSYSKDNSWRSKRKCSTTLTHIWPSLPYDQQLPGSQKEDWQFCDVEHREIQPN